MAERLYHKVSFQVPNAELSFVDAVTMDPRMRVLQHTNRSDRGLHISLDQTLWGRITLAMSAKSLSAAGMTDL